MWSMDARPLSQRVLFWGGGGVREEWDDWDNFLYLKKREDRIGGNESLLLLVISEGTNVFTNHKFCSSHPNLRRYHRTYSLRAKFRKQASQHV